MKLTNQTKVTQNVLQLMQFCNVISFINFFRLLATNKTVNKIKGIHNVNVNNMNSNYMKFNLLQ